MRNTLTVNCNEEQLAEYRQRYVAAAMRDGSIADIVDGETCYAGSLAILQHTADELFEMLEGNPCPYMDIEELRRARLDEQSRLDPLALGTKAQVLKILMREVLDEILAELAIHGIEWVEPSIRDDE